MFARQQKDGECSRKGRHEAAERADNILALALQLTSSTRTEGCCYAMILLTRPSHHVMKVNEANAMACKAMSSKTCTRYTSICRWSSSTSAQVI